MIHIVQCTKSSIHVNTYGGLLVQRKPGLTAFLFSFDMFFSLVRGVARRCRLCTSRICPISCVHPLLKRPSCASVKIAHFVARIHFQKTPACIRFWNDTCAHPFSEQQIGSEHLSFWGLLPFFTTAETHFRQSPFFFPTKVFEWISSMSE